ncbi:hypothetical protein GOQ27_05350 [Clostridium sp. D2Q-11]|uniref:DUF4309 domain-containing protein n=1 Tax=Anaeromonas frigoriresistens TaxID=2683708 RepID=A0A942Z6R9_9FIRM|nr:hypothetical protein [Anaeromonas frigoriresistens]MBS4537877.1 hypothetical protein [Anaeromonas frigoriresistens]
MKKLTILISILSITLLFGCKSKDEEISVKDDEQPIIESNIVENEDNLDKINPLFDTSELQPSDKEIFFNDELNKFENTISKAPLRNDSSGILVDFHSSYEALGFDSEVVRTDEDIKAIASDGNRSIYIAINIENNIKSISINGESLDDDSYKMYILSNEDVDPDRADLLVPLDFIAKSIDSPIVEGKTKGSLLLNDKLRTKNEEDKKDDSKTKSTENIFSDLGVKIGDSLKQAVNTFGKYGESGEYQGSTYYSFDHVTVFADPDTSVIESIGIFDNKYSIDGIKVGDSIEKVYEKAEEKESLEEFEGSWIVFYQDYKGYKAEFTLDSDKTTITAITIYQQ